MQAGAALSRPAATTSRAAHCPVALSADAYADSRERALVNGFDAVLTKPVTLDQVRTKLERRIKAPIVSIAACAAGMLDNVEWAVGAIETYRDEVPLHVQRLREAIARRERRALLEAAHALRGVSDICRVTRVSAVARAIEHGAEGEDWRTLETLGEKLVDLLERAAAECTHELERIAEPSLRSVRDASSPHAEFSRTRSSPRG